MEKELELQTKESQRYNLEDEKISKSEINDELSKLKSKDKDPDKKGVQGLSKNDLTKYRRLNLAKTLKGIKEHQEQENYMFFGKKKRKYLNRAARKAKDLQE